MAPPLLLLLFFLLLAPSPSNAGTLYPPITPFHSGYLNVSSLHSIYYEQSGNPLGVPIILLHGGPGSGTSPTSRQFFDPEHYHIVLFDQRGSGLSKPAGELRENDTWALVADIEAIRKLLGFERMLIFGGSWGSTLAIAYAQKYPHRVVAMVLRGIYTHREGEADWLFQDGASHLYPEAWENYVAVIPEEERGDYVKAYYKRLVSEDYNVSLQAARDFVTWECKIASLQPDQESCDEETDAKMYQKGSIELHYFNFDMFFTKENQLLKEVWKIRHIPAIIVHGRYDIVCPFENAWELAKRWPEAELQIAPTSGHSQWEPEITSLLVDATDKYRSLTP